MAPWKEAKASSESSNPNTNIISDTSPKSQDTTKTWTQVFDILQYELINCPNDSGVEETKTQATKYKTIAQLELHKIATRPRLMPYNDMISWALENVDLSTKNICNLQKFVVGSFKPEHF
jgi:hypothetical protein